MTTQPTGRRAANRLARHDQLLTAATAIISESGLSGLTMQAVSERVNCAVGTIYTYFSSKSALLAELQVGAITTLIGTVEQGRVMWDEEIDAAGLDEASAALVRLVALGHLFVAGPDPPPPRVRAAPGPHLLREAGAHRRGHAHGRAPRPGAAGATAPDDR